MGNFNSKHKSDVWDASNKSHDAIETDAESISKVSTNNVKRISLRLKYYKANMFYRYRDALYCNQYSRGRFVTYFNKYISYLNREDMETQAETTVEDVGEVSESVLDDTSEEQLLQKMREHSKQYEMQYHYVECATLFYLDLQKCRSKADILHSFVVLVKMLIPGSLTTTILHADLFTSRSKDIEHELEEQSLEEGVDTLHNILKSFRDFQKTELYNKVYKLFTYVLSYSVFAHFGLSFDSAGYNLFEQEAIKRKCSSKREFVFVALETFVLLFKKGIQIIRTGRIDSIYHSADTYAAWFDTAERLKLQSKYLANPAANDFDEFKFRRELDHCVDQGACILQCLDQHDKSILYIKNLYKELLSIKFDLNMKQDAKKPRREPYAILINGDSGIGKSTIKEMCVTHFFKVKDREYNAAQVFTKNAVAKYWDGFSTSQNVIILDDIAFMHPNKASEGDPSVMEFLQIINSVPYVPDQAALDDKGRTPLKAELVVGTTNTKDLNLHYYFQCPTAAQRRFPYVVTPTLKEKYKNEFGILQAVPQIEGTYPDYWIWKVEQPILIGGLSRGKPATFREIATFDNVVDFLDWYAKSLIEFEKKQVIVEESLNNIISVQICPQCKLLNCACSTQSEVTARMGDCVWYSSLVLIIGTFCSFISTNSTSLMNLFWRNVTRLIINMLTDHWIKWRRSCARRLLILYGRSISMNITPQRVILFAVGVFSLYKVLQTIFSLKEQALVDVGKQPEPAKEEPTNVWYKNDYILTPFNVSQQSASTKKLERASFIKNVEREILRGCVAYIDPDSTQLLTTRFNLFCLKGRKYVANAHSFVCFDKCTVVDITICSQPSRDGITSNNTFRISKEDIVFIEDYDICVLHLNGIPPKKGLYDYIGTEIQDAKNPCFYITRDSDTSVIVNDLRRVQLTDYKGKPFWSSNSTKQTVAGHSGSPMFMQTPMGYVLIGIHATGNVITQNIMAAYMDKSFFHICESEVRGTPLNKLDDVGDLHKKSVFRYIEFGTAEVYGSFNTFRVGGKSRVGPTLCQKFFLDNGYEIKNFAPDLTTYRPWRIAALDLCNPNFQYDPCIMNLCINGLLHDILDYNLDLAHVHPYDQFTAINGAAGVAYVDHINRSTSAGYPYRKSKKYYLQKIPAVGELLDPVQVTPEVQVRIEEMYNTYLKGERVNPIFIAHLKDEPVSKKKADIGKTRVFAGAPFDWSILVRMFYLPMIRLIQNNSTVFECAVGVTAQSTQWNDLYHYLTFFGKSTIVAGDFAAFDKQMCLQAMDGAFDIMIYICQKSGNYTEDDLRIMQGIKLDTIQPFMDFNGDLVQWFATNPSGHPLTVILNSLVNAIYMRYVYFLTNPEKEIISFKKNVHLMTYGDDNIMGVNPKTPWFNHTSIANGFKSFGIEYTMADKEAKSVPYIHIAEATFLKRAWRYHEALGTMVCPIDHDSINRALTVWVSSKTICPEEQMQQILCSELREYFWYGQNIFNKKRILFAKCWEKYLLNWCPDIDLPTFDQLVQEYKHASNSKSSMNPLQYECEGYVEQCDTQIQKLPQEVLHLITMFLIPRRDCDLFTYTQEQLVYYEFVHDQYFPMHLNQYDIMMQIINSAYANYQNEIHVLSNYEDIDESAIERIPRSWNVYYDNTLGRVILSVCTLLFIASLDTFLDEPIIDSALPTGWVISDTAIKLTRSARLFFVTFVTLLPYTKHIIDAFARIICYGLFNPVETVFAMYHFTQEFVHGAIQDEDVQDIFLYPNYASTSNHIMPFQLTNFYFILIMFIINITLFLIFSAYVRFQVFDLLMRLTSCYKVNLINAMIFSLIIIVAHITVGVWVQSIITPIFLLYVYIRRQF